MKLISIVVCVMAASAHAQMFSILPDGPPVEHKWQVEGPRPSHGTIFNVNRDALAAQLAKAPTQRFDAALGDYGLVLSLPGPTGEMIECAIAESPVMEPALQARFSDIRTYIVQSLDRTATGRIEVAPRGVTAMLRTVGYGALPGGEGSVWMIDPWRSGDPNHGVSYWLRDLPGGFDWACHTTEGVHGFGSTLPEDDDASVGPRAIQTLRTLRIAVACTGEYGLHQCTVQGHEPNAADPIAAIVTVVARTNVVYEADLAIHFNLVANNDQIVYFDPATDPYPDSCDGTGGKDCSGPYLEPNMNNLANVIGNSNFDIGHLMTRVYGGVAYLSSVCRNARGGGISGIPRGGDIDPFAALVVIHEIGHQFGANHTFSGTRGRCQGNVRLASAWEAGSGSSPMAYAGGCPVGDAPPTDNVAQFAEPYFHHGSYREMQNFLVDINCPVQTASGNNIPIIVSVTGDTSIPPGTPFTLTAQAMDIDGDLLTYSWEQFDSGVARPLSGDGAEDNGDGALFRSFPPTLSPERTFPQMSDVLAGVATPGERLPTVTGVTRQFRVIVRDNHAGAGATVVSSRVRLFIPGSASPFSVVSPAAGVTLEPGSTNVRWNVGGTNLVPISCPTVTIRLSTDDGATFDHLLGAFPNTGSAAVTLPELGSSDTPARIRVEGAGRIFFAVSGSFVLGGNCAADFNGDGAINSQDFFDFLTAFFDNNADFNNSGGTDSQDFFDFLTMFFDGC